MPPTESFDDLEKKIAGVMEEALGEVRGEFEERLQAVQDRMEEVVNNELAVAREEAEAAAETAAEQEAARAAAVEEEAAKVAAAQEALAAAEESLAESERAAASAREEAAAAAEVIASLKASLEEAAGASDEIAALKASLEEASAAGEEITALTASLEEADAARAALEAEADLAAQGAATTAAADLMVHLQEAVAEIDRARTQSDILHALLSTGTAFWGRTALFLTHEDGLKGWAHRGFDISDDDFQQLTVGYFEGADWSQVVQGKGVIELGDHESSGFCSNIDDSRPCKGVMIPLVLRDRLAAALYADHLDAEADTSVGALQLLAYIAGQALETLPLTKRSATATLRLATEAVADEPALELWQFIAPAVVEEEFVEAVEEVVEAPVEAAVVEAEETGVEIEDTWEEPVAEPEPGPAAEDFQPVEETDFEMAEATAPLDAVEAVDLQELIEDASEVEEPEAIVEPEEPVAAFDDYAAMDEGVGETRAISIEPEAIEPETYAEPPAVEMPDVDMPLVEEAIEVEPVEEVVAPVEEPMAEPEEIAVEEPADVEVAPPQDAALPQSAAGNAAVVAPPEDVDGPGWAFTTRHISAEGGGDPGHEEAKRLARLLVTEIKLYNEEQVEEGRRNQNVYQALREDIDRSRQIYEERIDEGIRADTDYFRDELVRILAGGDAETLGL